MRILQTTRCVGLLAGLLTFAGLSSASVIGTLSEANCSGGGVTVTATTITWLPAAGSGFGCISTGLTTSLTWSGGGSLGPGVNGVIRDLTLAPNVNVNDFMVFPAPPIVASSLDFVLTTLPQAVSTDGVCKTTGTGVAGVGHSCVLISGYTPFLLQYNGVSGTGNVENTTITALAGGTVADPNNGAMSAWGGNFHTSLNETPAQIELSFLRVGSVSSTQAGDFQITAVPEPDSMLLMAAGAGLIGLAKILRRRK